MPLSAHFLLSMRRGFSLVELLVVIGIVAVMAGLVLSSLFRNRDSNRLLAAEHMLADSIRQARHTARSNNAPVELRIVPIVEDGQVTGARVSGVTRVAIWGETFDGIGKVLPEINVPQNGWVIGRSGNGWAPNNTFPPYTSPYPYQFIRGQSLVRGKRSEGFYIACYVQPPAPHRSAHDIPLLLIGDSDKKELSQCGLELNRVLVLTLVGTMVITWEVKGWVRGENSPALTTVSSVNPNDRPLARTDIEIRRAPQTSGEIFNEVNATINYDPNNIIIPHRWVEIGLLYDGQRLMLFADGQRIAVHHGDVPVKLTPASSVYIGQFTQNPPPPPPQPHLPIFANCPMDDIRLYRLGTSEVGDLPGGVVLVRGINGKPDSTLGYRILCHGDGRVEVYRDDDTNKRALNDRTSDPRNPDDATIILSQRLVPGSLQNVSIQIGLDGRVNSSLVRPGSQP